jgi:hypothetical protein
MNNLIPVATDQSLLEGALMLAVVFAAAFAFAWIYEYFQKKQSKDKE